jgi:CheY-like chemotaxis protein
MAGDKSVILVVDDDDDFLAITRHALKSAGYDVVCCLDPQAALDILATTPCDLVISDLIMTCLDSGFTLARQIKEDPRFARLPVVIATSARSASGYDFRPRGPEDLAQMHADAYLEKPVPRDVLLKTVADLLSKAAQRSNP